ncbi:MAG TPA: histidine kinase [Cyclobacteriaceae bacterium]|nr:histidine kinase [Cyclobacteriaceae bacterium]
MRKFCLENWKTFIWLTLAGFAMTVLWVPPWERPLISYLKVGSFTSLLWNTMWLGNAYTGNLVSRRLSWMEEPVKRFLVGMVVMIAYTLTALFAIVFFYEFALGMRFYGDVTQLIWTTLSITFVISLFMHGRSFLGHWKTAELNAVELQKESMKAQYDSLKSQVNPHFLFNSLNALTNLIYEDQDKAARFVKQLSEVYRYVLDTQGKEVVSLDEEVKFLKSYLFLQQIRFGDKLKVELQIDSMNVQVAPLVLQMLVENAIKHNIISTDQPLMIKISGEKDSIIVENNIQKKNVLPEDSKGIGLENIRRRYSFLGKTPVEVIDTGELFTVKLPVL